LLLWTWLALTGAYMQVCGGRPKDSHFECRRANILVRVWAGLESLLLLEGGMMDVVITYLSSPASVEKFHEINI